MIFPPRRRSILIILFLGLFLLSFIIALIHTSVSAFGEKIGVIELKGVITDSREINEQIISMGEREDIKAILLRLDSPGGGVAPSQEIYEEIKKVKKKKKVIASIGSVAASGGYYIATAADKIVANPGSITGSIGVIFEFADFQELLRKIGIRGYVVKSGKFKDIGSPLREMRDDERRLIKGLIDDVHKQFVKVVSENRGIEKEKVEEIADGRIFTGNQALLLGLVDRLGNFHDAVKVASDMVGIKGKPILVYPERKKGILNLLFGRELEGLLKEVNSRISSFNYLYFFKI